MSYYGGMQTPGLGNVGSYLISAHPYLTGSNVTGNLPNGGEVNITFPSVCRSFTVVNIGSEPLYVHFDSRTNSNIISNKHYALISNNGDSWQFAVRAVEVYVSMVNSTNTGSFLLNAELTCIDRREMSRLSGSGING